VLDFLGAALSVFFLRSMGLMVDLRARLLSTTVLDILAAASSVFFPLSMGLTVDPLAHLL